MDATILRRCNKCAQSKPLDDFYRKQNSPDGRQSVCKVCTKKYHGRYYQTNRVHILEQQVIKHQANPEIKRRRATVRRGTYHKTAIGRTTLLIDTAKKRAKQKQLVFAITKEHVLPLLVAGKCQQSGFRFELQVRQNSFRNPFAPSIDRIDNTRGYEPDNIQLVCNMFNSGKGEHNELDFIAMCVSVAKKHQNNPAVLVRLMELGVL